MARRKTVKVNIEKISELTALQGWSAATLAKRVGKHERWISEIKRNKNLPSPEEAARMCDLLHTTPEEILLEPDDIALVRELIGSAKKDLPQGEAELSELQKEAWKWLLSLSDENLKKVIAIGEVMIGE